MGERKEGKRRRGRRGEGREIIKLIMMYLLKCLDEKFEGILILMSILIFKDPKYRINKNSV